MADGKIYITITDEPISETSGGTQAQKEKKDKKQKKQDQLNYQFNEFIKEEAIKFANYQISNIGFYTGNYQAQREVAGAMAIGYKIINIGNAVARSIAWGSPIPTIIAVGSMAINTGLEIVKSIEQNKRQNYEINILRDISGLSNKTNGSR